MYIAEQIEHACYDKADDWIYRAVYPVVSGTRIRPFLNELRGYLESQPGAEGSLDAAYVGDLALNSHPGKEDLRAACHRMLARSGRRRLMAIVAKYRATAPPPKADRNTRETGRIVRRIGRIARRFGRAGKKKSMSDDQ